MGHRDATGTLIDRSSSRAEPARLVPLNLSVSTDLDGLLDRISREMGISKADAILRGIALLKAALDAKRDGKAVGAADSADTLETEFVGF